jgi:hypothetical protein
MTSVFSARGRRAVTASCLALIGAVALGTGLASPSAGAPRLASTASPHTVAAPDLANKCHRSAIDVPSCGVLWGLYTQPVAGKPHFAPHYGTFERAIGRRFDIVKDYVGWERGVTFPNSTYTKLAGKSRRILYVSWNGVNYDTRASVSYRSIAAGKYDKSVILPEARRLKAFHQKIFIDFNHEFDAKGQASKGTPAQYVAAYRHIHDVFHNAGVTNVIWSWVSTGTMRNIADIKASWPGAKYVDWVGYDPYNFATCTGAPWHTSFQTFEPFYHWLRTQRGMRHKPILLGEYASAMSPGSIGSWYASLANTLRRLPRIKALFQWSAATLQNCDVSLADSAAAMAGFATASNAPYVTGVQISPQSR